MKTEYILLGTGLIAVLYYMSRRPNVVIIRGVDSNENVQTEKQPAESGVEMDSKNSGASKESIIGNASKIGVPLAAGVAGAGLMYAYKKKYLKFKTD